MLDGYIRPNKYVKLQPLLKYEPDKPDENLTRQQNKKVKRKLCKMQQIAPNVHYNFRYVNLAMNQQQPKYVNKIDE